MKWKIYYRNGETLADWQAGDVSNLDVEWHRGVLVIVQEDDKLGWRTQSGEDYYVWDDRGSGYAWWGVDKFGLYDYLIEKGNKIVLFGWSCDSAEFSRVFMMAKEDKYFEGKIGYNADERRPE